MALPPLQSHPLVAADGSRRFRLRHDPPAGVRQHSLVLYAHPFAEEMNKSRRMAALAARALAEAGCTVVQIDLAGCGDSDGEFEQASWAQWVEDVRQAAAELACSAPELPLWLWGLRAGALLCTQAAPLLPRMPNLLFWQPVTQGKTQLQQFLRLKAAAEMAGGQAKAVLDGLRAELDGGRAVDIAGYRLPAAIASGLEQAQLAPPLRANEFTGSVGPEGLEGTVVSLRSAQTTQLLWLEITAREGEAQASPAADAALARWQRAGWAAQHQAVSGPSFWQTVEIEEAPALVQATVQRLCGFSA